MISTSEDLTTVLTGSSMIDGNGNPPLHDVALVVQGDKIVAITEGEGWRDLVADIPHQVHDYPNATFVPGYVDGHVHLAFSALDDVEDVLAEYLESDDLRLAAMSIENAHRSLSGGVTTVRDCGGPGTLVQSLRDAVHAGVTRGPRILASGMPITTTAGHCHFFGLEADGEHEVRRAVRGLVKDDVDFIKVMATGGRVTRNSNIFEPQFTEGEMSALVQEARRLERRVASHALSTAGIRNSVLAGVDTIEHCNWQDGAGGWNFDEHLLDEMAEQGTHVSITLVGYMREAYSAWQADPDSAPITPVLKRRYELESEMFARGLNAFITSDAGVPGSHFAELHRSVAVAVGWLGLDVLTAIAAVTSRAARALGVEDEVGSLEVGKFADINVLDGSPTDDVANLGRLVATYLAGEKVVQAGGVLPSDPRRIGPRPAGNRRRGGWVP